MFYILYYSILLSWKKLRREEIFVCWVGVKKYGIISVLWLLRMNMNFQIFQCFKLDVNYFWKSRVLIELKIVSSFQSVVWASIKSKLNLCNYLKKGKKKAIFVYFLLPAVRPKLCFSLFCVCVWVGLKHFDLKNKHRK